MNNPLKDRVAIITGASRNIGRAIALDLAAAGATVVVNAKTSGEAAAEVVQTIEAAGGKAVMHLADVGDQSAAEGLIAAAVERFGRLDMLVNNAAIRRETNFEDLEWQEWRNVFSAILDSAYLCARAALPHLKNSDLASVINIGGMSAHSGSTGRAHVIAAKAGLVGLTRALAHDLGPNGITVNCVVPGLIATERGKSTEAMPAHHVIRSTLLGRRGMPEEVAALVCFLCGPSARFITGQTIHANGGAYLS